MNIKKIIKIRENYLKNSMSYKFILWLDKINKRKNGREFNQKANKNK